VKMNDTDKRVDIDTYVKIIGTVRVVHNERKIIAHNICNVVHPAEYDCHHLAVEYNRLRTNAPVVDTYVPIIDTDARKVHDVIADDDVSENGPDIQEICASTRLPVDKVRRILETLQSEGFVYSTIDEEHYRSTGALV